MRNTEKGFQNVSFAAGDAFQKDFAARGMACGDLDNDGDVDIIIAQTDGTPLILKNNGTKITGSALICEAKKARRTAKAQWFP